MKTSKIKIGKSVVVESLTEDGEWIGFGAVSIDGVTLRGSSRPFEIKLDTPDGYLYHEFKFKDVEKLPDGGARIILSAVAKHNARGEYFDDFGQAVVWLEPYKGKIEDELSIDLKPVSQELAGRQLHGFSYSFTFKSATRKIHRILTHATWEIGGSIVGNTVLSQGQCNMPVYYGAKETLFTSACLRTLDQYGKPQGNSMQLGSRCGLIQGFDFQFSDAGALFQYWPMYDSVSSLIESRIGEDSLNIVDEYHFEISNEVSTIEKNVLFVKGQIQQHEGRDLWWEAIQLAYGSIMSRLEVKESLALPELSLIQYSPSEVLADGIHFTICGERVRHDQMANAITELVLPRLVKQGVKRFFPEPLFTESDVSVLGMKRKLDSGIHGDLHCSSVCGTHRYFPSEFWGGIKGWRQMADKAHSLGLEIGTWASPHFSPRAPILAEHPDWFMTDVCGFPAGGGYGFQTIVVGDWNSGLCDWVYEDFRRWQEEGGLDYLFIDSYSNMGLLQVNYANRFRTNFLAFGKFFSRLQKIGIHSFNFESISSFGIASFGLSDLRQEFEAQNKGVAGQNDFGWWVGEEDMAFNCALSTSPKRREAPELEHIEFKTMASRGFFRFSNTVGTDYTYSPWLVRLNKIYMQAMPYMAEGKRRLLPDGAGVRWESKGGTLYWTFKDVAVPSGSSLVELDGETMKPCKAMAKLPAWTVHIVKGSK